MPGARSQASASQPDGRNSKSKVCRRKEKQNSLRKKLDEDK